MPVRTGVRLSTARIKKLLNTRWRITISTMFTILRIALTPVIVAAMITQYWGVAFWLFIVAALTDTIDGTLARLLNQKTFLGALLDPIADKILLLSCFFVLAFVDGPLFTLPRWFVLFVLVKELLLIVGVAAIYWVRGSITIEPSMLGKATTVVQIFFIIWLFACYFFHWVPIKTYYVMLSLVTILVSSVLGQYAVIGYKQLAGQYEALH